MYSDSVIKKLRASINWSREQLRPHREYRGKLIKEYASSAYDNEESADKKTYNNLWAQAVEVMQLAMSGGTPQVSLYTARRSYLPFAADFSAVINQEMKRLNFGETVSEWVLEMFFGLGVLKVGTEHSHYLKVLPGRQTPRSELVFADVVDLDNWVHDARAKKWDQLDYCGDKYFCRYDYVKNNEMYDETSRRLLQAKKVSVGDYMAEFEREGDLAQEAFDYSNEDHIFEYIELWDIYIPSDNMIITMSVDQPELPPLLVQEWTGPANGPYYVLAGAQVPGNLMPRTPGHHLKPMHDLVNNLYRKLARQAANQKTILMVTEGNEKDAMKVSKAQDTEVISVSDPAAVKEVNFLGPNQANQAFAMHAYDVFSRLAGNLDAMAGLGPQSQTVGQDQLILGTVDRRLGRMSENVLSKVIRVVTDIGWYIWNSSETFMTERGVDGTQIKVPVVIGPQNRVGDFYDFDFTIAPYSLSYSPPGQRAQMLVSLVTQLILPALPMMQQQGVEVDFSVLLQLLANENAMPELNNIIKTGVPNAYSAGSDSPPKPAVTSRTYERVNRPGATREGNTQTMMQMASGKGVQPAQQQAMMRPTTQ